MPQGQTLSQVFGYLVINDVSARDNRRAWQWIFAKRIDSDAPLRPCIGTADNIPDPQMLDLWLCKDGVQKQRSNTAKMLI
jgi:2-keto-4-pentenoate hydratase/2-oxohepta-3-ene-1,7-dioic acid hydratase in catechol pathway